MVVQPCVARSWDISEDGLTYTFHMDPRARWSNGDSVTAEDFSFFHPAHPFSSPRCPVCVHALSNPWAEAFNKGETQDFSSVGVHSPDPATLIVRLAAPTPYFLGLLAHNTWWPVHPPTILKHGGMTERISKWTKPENFVGNGPYVLESWQLNHGITAKKNPYYRDAENAELNRIHFLPIEMQTEERAFRAGHLHITSSVPVHRVDWYKEHRPEQLRVDTALGTYYYMLNTKNGPLADKRVRQALAYAIDRDQITGHILRRQVPALHFTPPQTGGYNAQADCLTILNWLANFYRKQGFRMVKASPNLNFIIPASLIERLPKRFNRCGKQNWVFRVTLHNQEWKAYLSTRQKAN